MAAITLFWQPRCTTCKEPLAWETEVTTIRCEKCGQWNDICITMTVSPSPKPSEQIPWPDSMRTRLQAR